MDDKVNFSVNAAGDLWDVGRIADMVVDFKDINEFEQRQFIRRIFNEECLKGHFIEIITLLLLESKYSDYYLKRRRRK